MMKRKYMYCVLTALAACLFWTGCKEDVQFVKLSKTTATIYLGDSIRLKVQTDGEALFAGAVTWSVKEETAAETEEGKPGPLPVVELADDGTVKGVNYGEAVIKATLDDGRYLLGVVTVAERIGPKDPTFSFEQEKYYINPTGIVDSLVVNIDPELLKLYPLTFSSSDESVVKIDPADSLKTTTQEGTYKIAIHPQAKRSEEPVVLTATLGEAEISCEVYANVKLYLSLMPIGADNTEIDQNSYRFSINNDQKGKDTIMVYYRAIPDDKETIAGIDFKVSTSGEGLVINERRLGDASGEYLIVVTSGGVPGNAVVTVEAVGRKVTASCEVYDRNDYYVESVTMLNDSYVIEDVLFHDLFSEVEVAPFGITDYWPIVWSSSNDAIGTVDGNGRAVFLAPGEVDIIATSRDKSAKCHFTVLLKVSSVTIGRAADEIFEGEQLRLTAAVEGNFRTIPADRYKWSSSNPAVAEVSAEGVVTAKAAGDAVITVSVTDDNGNTVTDDKAIAVKGAGDIAIHDVTITDKFVVEAGGAFIYLLNYDELDQNNYENYLTFRFTPNIDLKTPRKYTIGQDGFSGEVTYLDAGGIEETKVNLLSGTIDVQADQVVFDLKAGVAGKQVSISGAAKKE